MPGLWSRIRPGHCGLTATSQALVREIDGIDFGRLAEKTVAKCITALPNSDGTEKAMAFDSSSPSPGSSGTMPTSPTGTYFDGLSAH
ncbi:hypothetical protein NY78_3304 [Desulfovibrio sp. TomC]|nr:hypothetical protein NY78_3304 [Desulfovibrio sp. TomC]